MRYVLAGKKDTYKKYLKDNNYTDNRDALYVSRENFKNLNTGSMIEGDDTIVLLPGWFAKSDSKTFIKEVQKLYPSISFEYMDGKIGEKERKSLQSDRIYSRFDILDL
jgi:hypothetical protein